MVGVLGCGCAHAAWEKVDETKAALFYADRASARQVGRYHRVWTLIDFKAKQADGTRSIRGLEEYDCIEQRVRFLSQTNHSEPMAEGTVLGGVGAIDHWDFIAPNTTLSRLMAVACSAK